MNERNGLLYIYMLQVVFLFFLLFPMNNCFLYNILNLIVCSKEPAVCLLCTILIEGREYPGRNA